MSCVYLLHFDKPFNRALHYVGFSNAADPLARVASHNKAKGGKFTSKVCRAGIKMELVHYWKNANMKFERYLKDEFSFKDLCPACGGTPIPQLTREDRKFYCEGTN